MRQGLAYHRKLDIIRSLLLYVINIHPGYLKKYFEPRTMVFWSAVATYLFWGGGQTIYNQNLEVFGPRITNSTAVSSTHQPHYYS